MSLYHRLNYILRKITRKSYSIVFSILKYRTSKFIIPFHGILEHYDLLNKFCEVISERVYNGRSVIPGIKQQKLI